MCNRVWSQLLSSQPWVSRHIPNDSNFKKQKFFFFQFRIHSVPQNSGQIAPQIVAATFPVQFCDIPFSWTVTRICIFLDSIGLTYFSWLEAKAIELIFRPNRDVNNKLHEHGIPPTEIVVRTPDMETFQVTKTGSIIRKAWDLFRFTWCTLFVIFCFAFVLPGVATQQTFFSQAVS